MHVPTTPGALSVPAIATVPIPRPHPTVAEHGYVAPDYLQSTAALAARCKQRSHDQMHLQPGHRALDVGCGIGIDVLQLAARVGPAGAVVGVDADPDMVLQAGARIAVAGVRHATVRIAAAHALPDELGRFDAVRSERMLQHVDDPEPVVQSMLRLTRLGGRVVLLDTDWGSLSLHHPDPDLERRMVAFKAGQALRNGYAGRRLHQWLKHAGLQNLSLEVLPLHATDYATARHACALDDLCRHALRAGAVTPAEVQRFDAGLRTLDASGGFYACVNMVLVAGSKVRHGH